MTGRLPSTGGEAERTPDVLFADFPETLAVCRAVEAAVLTIGETAERVTRSQVAFSRRRGFAYVWRPGQYVASDVPAVLSIAMPREISSARVKEVVHPSRQVWMHHIELVEPGQVDEQVRAWLVEAYDAAG